MQIITSTLLRQLSPLLTEAQAAEYAGYLDTAAKAGGLTTWGQFAAFIAQTAHESAGFRFLYELWGPTSAQAGYEGRRNLGNTQPGDGFRYRGRGFIQLTGRANYAAYGRLLGLPLEQSPDMAARPEVAARVAVAYWTTRRYPGGSRVWTLNELADAGDFTAITRAINGGTNGLMDRYDMLDKALRVLSAQAIAYPQPTANAPVPVAAAKPVYVDPGTGAFAPLSGRQEYAGPFSAAVVNTEKAEGVYIRLERG